MNNIIINNQLEQIGNALKQYDYNGFKYNNVIRQSDRDSYQFTFLGSGENTGNYFILEVTHQAIVHMKMEDVFTYIHNQVRNHPDLKKAAHHQEFYNKFDEILK